MFVSIKSCHFEPSHTGHFLDTAAGFVGCIRRLEINNKIYNFEPAERQGDVLFGIDIGELAQFVRVIHETYHSYFDLSSTVT